ncbi:MAG: chemotaxis protein CheX [Desulfarculus sp.]|jgi:chemotaxis protein CheX|nr:chemotaxis protein CheX [Desulfarculus sp.]
MNVEYINPFLKATANVLKTMAFTEANPGKPYLKKEAAAAGDISGVIGITGETEGSLSVSFSESCICHIVGNMFGEPVTSINKEVEDAVGELTNMISGDARRELAEKGIVLKSAIPTVISGKNHTVKHMANGPAIAIPFETPGGPFLVEVCFNR